jgi:hypothetical protein
MTEFEVVLFILLACWALGKTFEIIERLKSEHPRPPALFIPQLPKTTKIELFGGIPNKQVWPGSDSRCEICEGGFGSQAVFHSGMANDSRLVCSACRDLMISIHRRSRDNPIPQQSGSV